MYFMRRKLSPLKQGPFYHKSVVIHCYILVHQIWREITSIWCFLAIKCQLSNTLKHVCFDKMPKNWEFAHEIHSLIRTFAFVPWVFLETLHWEFMEFMLNTFFQNNEKIHSLYLKNVYFIKTLVIIVMVSLKPEKVAKFALLGAWLSFN